MSERDIFTAARLIDEPAARAAYLAQACRDDAPLRARLEALLREHGRPNTILDHPAPGFDVALAGEADGASGLGLLAAPTRPGSLGRLGNYEALDILGRGGFGIVYRAFDDVLHRIVAVKVLYPHLAAVETSRKRFLREARSSAGIRHDNVVQVYDVREAPIPHLVMEYIPGETLQQRLDRDGPLGAAEAMRIGRQVAEALAAAHQAGLIHRDVKPANVLLEAGSGRAKLTDFGLARTADDASLSLSGQIAGTPMYMAPEQVAGLAIDARADLFSLGSVLYRMIAGRPPFRADGALALMRRVAEEDPPSIRDSAPDAPRWLCDVVSRLHTKEPGGRFQTAAELADLLGRLMAAPPAAEASLKSSAGRRPRGSARARAGAAALALLLCGVGLTEATGVHHTVTRLFVPEGTPAVEVDGSQAPPARDPGDPAQDPDRRAAEAMLSKGGSVWMELQGREITNLADLPDGPFRLAGATNRDNPRLTDDDLIVFEGCPQLLEIILWGSPRISDAGMRHLAGLRGLLALGLGGTAVTDAGMETFRDFTSIESLHLSNTKVGPAGLANFLNCKKLRHLNLDSCTRFSDRDVPLLLGWTNLKVLYMDGTGITDAGVVRLDGLKELQELRLLRTRVSREGVEALARTLPRCRITWDGGSIGGG